MELLSTDEVNYIVNTLHEKIQFYDKKGLHNNPKSLKKIEKVLLKLKVESIK